jgi:hydrogenase maturation protease
MCSAATERRPATLVVGLGNPILADDAVGWRIVDAFDQRLSADAGLRAVIGPVDVDRLAVGGLGLMERLVGYDRVLIADAAVDGRSVGSVWSGGPNELLRRPAEHVNSAHDVTLQRAMELASALGAEVPPNIRVVTVTVARIGEFAEALSPAVESAVEPAVDAIIDALVGDAIIGEAARAR